MKGFHRMVCKENQCAGCMACIDICPQNAIAIHDELMHYNAVINMDKCIKCNACHRVCPNNRPVIFTAPIYWKQGWISNGDDRGKSSSGGFASAISRYFIQDGGVVFSCCFENGEFTFESANSIDALKRFRGSKYVKSSPLGVYKKIKALLIKKQKVLFIGLPCQVAGVINYVGKDQENLYTIDLICHGTPSPKLLDMYMQQSFGVKLDDIKDINFRQKNQYGVQINNAPLRFNRIQDHYMIAFLKGIDYTENCYSCQYARSERISDITIGDSWGSELSSGEVDKGISLALCQTQKGADLLNRSDLHLEEVDLENAIENNKQLHTPSSMPKAREKFFMRIKNKRKFRHAVFEAYPKECIKEDIKLVIGKLRYVSKRINQKKL